MISLRPSDLGIKTLDDGREVVQLRGAVAFDENFINEMKEAGVAPYVEKQKESENTSD